MAVLEFRSPAAGGFIMMSDTFKRICEVLGRTYSESGCLLPEDMDAAIDKIENEISREKALMAQMEQKLHEQDLQAKQVFQTFAEEDEEKKARERISFCMRVYPFLEMLKAAKKKDVKLWWGVP